MHQYEDLLQLFFDNLKRIVFPEEWLAVDIEMSKQELFTIIMLDRLGEITMSQLSEQLNFPMSTATGVIDRLVKKGYIERGKSESDRRIVAVSLTEKGRIFTQQLSSIISSYIKRAYDSLDEEERQYLFRIFSKISAAFQKNNDGCEKENINQNQVRKIEIE
ncbi:MAG TPA: MarR family transcriptional regulator [Clostridia bacterium]